MSDQKPCDKELWAFGDVVGVYAANCGAALFERAVTAAAIFTEEKVDWHYVAGRAIVKCEEGKKEKVQETVDFLVNFMDDHADQISPLDHEGNES